MAEILIGIIFFVALGLLLFARSVLIRIVRIRLVSLALLLGAGWLGYTTVLAPAF